MPSYYSKTEYKLLGYRKSKRKNKKYDAILKNRKTDRLTHVPFGDKRYKNFHDLTGLNLYSTHGDPKRRANYRARHKNYLKTGYYSPSWFSFYLLW